MLPYEPVELVARNPGRGVARRWRMQAMRDLFGCVVVETAWGRIGAPGRTLVRSFAGEAEAGRYVRALLARRRGAVRRIGVDYVAGVEEPDPARPGPAPDCFAALAMTRMGS